MKAAVQSSDHWRSPAESIADRLPTKFRSKASTQGILIAQNNGTRQIFFESLGEYRLLSVLLARRDIVDVREQQEAVYRDDDGVVRRHYFDFVVTFVDGTRKALAYKPSDRALKLGFMEFLSDLATRISPEVADEIVLVSERDLPRDAVHNAVLFHDCRRDPPNPADAAVISVLSNIVGELSIGDLRDATGLGGDGYRAIVRLIGSGQLIVQGNARITSGTLVRAADREDAR
ncbi:MULTISPECIES: hypothetical protein [Methylobacterium]|uniref:hypothetical protein n=1 Tax=Methylobacterium TaxID=407 RepID=UPI0013EA3026|nr:hypothetical protein [Methylobacterium sp. DB0501]NGM38266.1 hypothetical protein [Methylobacterium sp. DB0501]